MQSLAAAMTYARRRRQPQMRTCAETRRVTRYTSGASGASTEAEDGAQASRYAPDLEALWASRYAPDLESL